MDHLHGDAAILRLVEDARRVAVQGGPRFAVALGLQGRFEGGIRVVRTQEVGVAHEEAFLVLVGVDEPAGDAVGADADDFNGARFEDVHAVHLHAELAVLLVDEGDVGLAEDNKLVALARVLEVFRHVEVGVHGLGQASSTCGLAFQLGPLRGAGREPHAALRSKTQARSRRLVVGMPSVTCLDVTPLPSH